jgi:hypothetical protein
MVVDIQNKASQKIILLDFFNIWGMRWCSWLRHCTTSRKVADLIPDCITGIFH